MPISYTKTTWVDETGVGDGTLFTAARGNNMEMAIESLVSAVNGLGGGGSTQYVRAVPSSQTSTYIIRPGSDITAAGANASTAWTPNTGTTNWSVIDDSVTQPTIGSPAIDDFTSFSGGGPVAYTGKFLPTTGISSGETVTNVTLWCMYAGTGGAGSFSFALLNGANTALATSTADTSTATTKRWASVSVSGTMLHSQLDQLRFSVTGSNMVNAWNVYSVYAVITTSGSAGGVFDNGYQVYSDYNPPETLMQTKTIEPVPNPSTGLAVSYFDSAGVPKARSDAGVVYRSVSQAEYTKLLAPSSTSVASTAIASSTAEQTIGSLNIPAGTIVSGTSVRFSIFGVMSQTSRISATYRLRVGTALLAGVVPASSVPVPISAALTNLEFELSGLITFRATGASGTVIGHVSPLGVFFHGATSGATAANNATVTIDTTVNLIASATIQPVAAGLTGTVNNALIMVVQP